MAEKKQSLLTKAQIQTLAERFRSLGVDIDSCPACSSGSMQISDRTSVMPVAGHKQHPTDSGLVFPYVTLLCNNCGFIRLFNAVYTGVFPQRTESKNEEDSEGDGG